MMGPSGEWAGLASPNLNAHELTSLSALIAYVAYTSGKNEGGVERQLADRFNIPNVQALGAERYEDAVRYLVDQVPETDAANG